MALSQSILNDFGLHFIRLSEKIPEKCIQRSLKMDLAEEPDNVETTGTASTAGIPAELSMHGRKGPVENFWAKRPC